MSIKAMQAAFDSNLPPIPRLVLLAIGNYAGADGKAWPTTSRLMRDTGVSERAIRDALRLLEKEGYMTIGRWGPRNVNNIYFLKLKDSDPIDDPVLI